MLFVNWFLLILTLFLALPGGDTPHAIWLAPFFSAVLLQIKTTSRSTFCGSAIGFFAGFLSWAVASWWLVPGVAHLGNISPLLAALPVALLWSANAIPYAVYGALSTALSLHGSSLKEGSPVTAALLFSTLVGSFTVLFPGTWAMSLYQTVQFQGWLSIGGQPLQLFLLVVPGFLLHAALNTKQGSSKRMLYLSIAAGTISISLLAGELMSDNSSLSERVLRIGYVQPNIEPQPTAPETDELEELFSRTSKLLTSDPHLDVIVWPEIPPAFSVSNNPTHQKRIDELLKAVNTPLLVNSVGYSNDTIYGRVPYFNNVQLLQGSSEIVAEYKKMKLIPFGEYLPLEQFLAEPPFDRILPQLRKYIPGDKATPISFSGHLVGTPVCFEATSLSLCTEFIRQGASLLINPTDDAYFASDRGLETHLALSVATAATLRVPIIRVTNTGVTALIAKDGKITRLTTPHAAAHGVVEVRTQISELPNTHQWLIPVLALIGILGELFNTREKKG